MLNIGLESPRSCVYCGEQNPLKTRTCLYCGEFLTPTSVKVYAGFFQRVCAFLVDEALFNLFCISLVFSSLFDPFTSFSLFFAFPIFYIIIKWVYFAATESSHLQGSLGKWVLRLKVVDAAGCRLSFFRASARFWLKGLSLLTFGMGYLMAAFTNEKQALHDLLSDCYVLHQRSL